MRIRNITGIWGSLVCQGEGFSKSVMPTGTGAGRWKEEKAKENCGASNFTKYDAFVDIQPGEMVSFSPRLCWKEKEGWTYSMDGRHSSQISMMETGRQSPMYYRPERTTAMDNFCLHGKQDA